MAIQIVGRLLNSRNTIVEEKVGDVLVTKSAAGRSARWLVNVTSFCFILLQSLCTAVMAVSGLRVLIGLGSLAAAAGLGRPASGFHRDAVRIPMMLIAVLGSTANLYMIWRVRSLRNRPAAKWRAVAPASGQVRSERFQIALAALTLLLVAAEWFTHRIVHNV